VFAVSRNIPSVGWGLIATVDRYQTYIPIWRLALAMFGGGLVIIVLSIAIVGSMARRITAPLLSLKQKLSGLETKKWNFERTIFTGNELEVVDQTAFDLTSRLKESYDNLEERVRARTREVLEKNAQDDAIFKSLQYGLLVTDRKGDVILLNDAGSLLTGWKEDEAKGISYTEILRFLTKDSTALPDNDHPMKGALESHEPVVPVLDPGYSIMKKNGKNAPIFITTAPIMKNGECLGVIALFRDVTEDRRIDQMKSQFISLASHQLRTPLSSIRWYVEMLLGGDEGALDEEKQKSVQEIGAANDRMIRMVTSLLHVANLELGTFTVHDETSIDVIELIRKIEKMFLFECKTRSIKLCEDFQTKGTLMRRTDPELLELILQNMISNAIKYSHDGSNVTIHVQEKDTSLSISVEDHGIGIPKKDQSKIFEKLFRADNAREVDTDGNGLGLYIAKIAADVIHVKIDVQSEEGKGTTFTLTL
jgi:two-component system sensor histidine kinase VicK